MNFNLSKLVYSDKYAVYLHIIGSLLFSFRSLSHSQKFSVIKYLL